MSGIQRIADERNRQANEEGHTPGHDDRHEAEELAQAAVCYALPQYARNEVPVKYDPYGGYQACAVREAEFFVPELWPWSPADWKPSPDGSYRYRIRELAKAGALMAAEIDRLERKMWSSPNV
jgi:hypothetical protein